MLIFWEAKIPGKFLCENGSPFCPSKGAGVTTNKNRGGYSGRGLFSVMPAKECKGLGARIFLPDVISTLVLHAMMIPDRFVSLWDISNIRISVNISMFVLPLTPPAVFCGSVSSHVQGGSLPGGGTPGGGAVFHPFSRGAEVCSAVPSNINVVYVRHIFLQWRGEELQQGSVLQVLLRVYLLLGERLCLEYLAIIIKLVGLLLPRAQLCRSPYSRAICRCSFC